MSFQKCFLFGATPVNNRDFSRESSERGKTRGIRAPQCLTLQRVFLLPFLLTLAGAGVEVWGVLSTPCTAVFIRALHVRSKSRVEGVLQFMTGTILLRSSLFPTSDYFTNERVFVWVFLLMFLDFLKVFILSIH